MIWSSCGATLMANCSVGVSAPLASAFLSYSLAQAASEAARQAANAVRMIRAGLFDDIADGSLIGAPGHGRGGRLVDLVQTAQQDGLGVVGRAQPVGRGLEVGRVG